MKHNQTLLTRRCSGSQPLRTCVWLATLIALAFTVISSFAQTVNIQSQPLRFTVAKGVASSNFCTLTIPVSGLANEGVDTVNLAVTGVPGSGAAAAFLSTNGLTSNLTYTATLILTNDATIAAGDYDLAVEATGAASFRLPVPVQVAYIWSGSDFTNSVSTNWTSTGNWIGGVVPGPTDPVVFKDISGMANANTTNVVVTEDATVASLRFSPETSGPRFNSVEILDGKKLSITGAGLSFSLHRDTKLANQRIDTYFAGGGTLEVSNPNAQIGVLVDQQQNATLDMRNLNTFVADVSRIGLGNYRIWPNVYTNGYTGQSANLAGIPTRFVPLVYLAQTNVIKCSWVDPNNYDDAGIRDYAIEVGNDTPAGTTTALRFSLGRSNAFFIDSICWSHSGKGAGGNTYNFHTADSYALFRGIGGGRMSLWVQGDASGEGTTPTGSNVRGNTCDFSNGQVDAMIDRLYLGRSRTNNNGITIQGTLTIGGNYPITVFDANTVILGYQDVPNLNAAPAQAVSGPVGTINVNSNATLRVNGDLQLGYTTASAAGGPDYAENCGGTLNINNSGTVMASNVLAGGATRLSVNNSISVNNSGILIVTNMLGASDARINSLTLANNAQLTLLGVATGQTAIYAKTFSAVSPCTINVPAIAGYVSGTVTIPLVSYQTASPNIAGLIVTPPAGLFAFSPVDDGAGTINVTFTDHTPQTLVWRGNVSSDWNTSDKNWVTQIGGLQTNFFDNDSVVFDDTVAAGPTSITISTPVAPGQVFAPYGIVVSNASYTFPSGSVIGAATLRKTGTGDLTINATFSPGILLNQGSLAGAGTVGPTSLEDGTTMTGFSGTINGGLTSSNAAASVTGIVNGGLKLLAGSLANSGTINGTVILATNVTLNNTISATMNVTLPWSVPTNSVLINNGTIVQSGVNGGNQGLTVNGTLSGVGKITQTGVQAPSDVRVTLGAGGVMQIGNNPGEITNNIIAVRLDLLAGSTTTFDVDNTTLANDHIFLTDSFIQGKVNFGAGNTAGGTLLVNKTAGPAFNLASTLHFFDLASNTPDNQNQAIPGVVPAPGPGLVWNVSRVVTNLTIGVMGPAFLTNSVSNGTNLVFDWSEANRGWRLERQTNSLAVGLEWNSTNWTTVASSFGGTNVYYPDTNDLSQFYFRSVQTISQTNAPTVFYRLTYP